ncbi:hypothetical protein KP509_19G061700 [Ceratopteris richardii]|uniref:RING-type domain-containing protein n=1 Tax=Ceratopteris richardii TaxID=49495 RepID=A0A8T2SKQ4_CERRI|nr:hypothetical protein KP509_19G061700 [Ceratopteris richardii]
MQRSKANNMIVLGNRKCRPFKESLKLLEADIQHANTMALGLPRESGGACLQMRLSLGPSFLLCFLGWADCNLISALGLLHVHVYKVLKDGTTTMSIHEKRASLREFYGYILPSLQGLDGGLTGKQAMAQQAACVEKYMKKNTVQSDSESNVEREKECGICLETVSKVVLPNCYHSLCVKCYKDWLRRSSSCPFCRASLKHVRSQDLWVLMDYTDTKSTQHIMMENLIRLFLYVDKLPLAIHNGPFEPKRKWIC